MRRKRISNIGVYPRIAGLPFYVVKFLIVTFVLSMILGLIAKSLLITLVPNMVALMVGLNLKARYGDFYTQRKGLKRYGRLKSSSFIGELSWQYIQQQESKK